MEDLIGTLREQHWNIFSSCDALENFCKSGINTGDDVEKWMSERSNIIFHLKNFKKILLEHLKLEDSSLYPALQEAKDKKIREISSKYSDEMKLISKRTISFFETYSHLKVDNLSQNENFRLELTTVITIIRRRIKLEESELYPLYDNLISFSNN